MANAERFAELIAESRTLDRNRDATRLSQIFAEAAALVDRTAQPKKWAALRSMYAQVSETSDRAGAIAGYRDALTVWDRQEDHDSWANCHLNLGFLLAADYSPGTPEAEQVIEHLEFAVGDHPFAANLLGVLYRHRNLGDPMENWRKRLQYAELALSQTSRTGDPVQWASLMNEVALCWSAEPGAPFNLTIEKRLQGHLDAFAALSAEQPPSDSPALKVWIETCIHLNEAYLFQVGGDTLANQKNGEEYARKALQASIPGAVPPELRVQAILALGRALTKDHASESLPQIRETLGLYDEAAGLIDPAQQALMAANVDKFRATSYLRLIELNQTGCVDKLIEAAESAYSRFDPQIYTSGRRSVMQTEAEGLVLSGRYPQAIGCLERAVAAGETALDQATTRQGRLEKVFELHDSWALLAYCHLEGGDIPAALECLDRGKSRFWRSDATPAAYSSFADLIPEGGALLFPVFAAAKGAVVVVSRSGAATCWLPDFGKHQLQRMLSGDPSLGELGGWLKARAFCHSEFGNWWAQIDSIGAELYKAIWTPLIATLNTLGIERDAELVWFSQAGTGVLPIHAAWFQNEANQRRWILDDYAIRYAPSVRALLRSVQPESSQGASLVVSDPRGDLKFALFESAWIRAALPASAQPVVLEGKAATAEAVLAALPAASLVHFTTHARFDLNDPFQSGLLAANGVEIPLDTLLPLLRQSPLEMVVLSACETAMARVTGVIDEMLGFPTAFLENGTKTVIATLWEVEDSSAAALVGRFYHEFLKEGKTPAQALRAAQNWLRKLTIADLSTLLKELKNSDPGPAGALAAKVKAPLRALDQELQCYAHPFFWAGFTVSGR